MRRERIE